MTHQTQDITSLDICSNTVTFHYSGDSSMHTDVEFYGVACVIHYTPVKGPGRARGLSAGRALLVIIQQNQKVGIS